MATIRHKIATNLDQFKRKRVAVYARVSREGAEKHHSMEAQEENLRAYIGKHPGWIFAGVYADEGVTGTKMNRPEFNRMMKDARAGKIDIILTKAVSRFGRNTAQVLKVLQELKELDVIVIFDSEQISTADSDCLIRLQYNSIMAEHEAEQNSKNKKWSVKHHFQKGIPSFFRIYGYRMVDNQLQVVPEEAVIVRRIFGMFLDGLGKLAISKKLNEDGIPSFYGNMWTPTSIYNILLNEKYTGDLLLQKWYVPDFKTKTGVLNRGALDKYFVEDAHEAIITRDIFDKTQQEIERRKELYGKEKRTNSNPPRIMQQLVRCEHCNKSIYYKRVKGGSVRELWVCRTHVEQGPKYCPTKSIRDDVLVATTREVLLQEKLIKKDTPLTNALLKKLILIIIAKENQVLEYHLMNDTVIYKTWQNPPRSKSWTPEMRQKARENALAFHAKRKEVNHE